MFSFSGLTFVIHGTEPVAQRAEMAMGGVVLNIARRHGAWGFGRGATAPPLQEFFEVIGYEILHFNVGCDVKTCMFYCASAS